MTEAKSGRALLTEALGFEPPAHRMPFEAMKTDVGIGIVGLHWVVQIMHLPAYRSAGFRVAAACDNSEDRIREVRAKGWPIGEIVTDWRALVQRPDVEVIDSSFGHNPGKEGKRRDLVEAAASAGKHVMIHKPAASTLGLAEEMASMAERAGIRLAVNHNARYNPSSYAVKGLLAPERMGPPCLIEVQNYWQGGPPKRGHRAGGFLGHVIHHADLIRWWVDAPCVSVFAREACNSTIALYEFADGTLAYHIENHSGVREHETRIRVQTERGVIRAGFNWNWHVPSAAERDFVEVFRSPSAEGVRLPLPVDVYEPLWSDINPWSKKTGPCYDLAAPVAGMMGSMGALMQGVREGREPDNGIRGAIESLRMALATEVSSRERRAVDPRGLPPETVTGRP